jgi:hypothetical protein
MSARDLSSKSMVTGTKSRLTGPRRERVCTPTFSKATTHRWDRYKGTRTAVALWVRAEDAANVRPIRLLTAREEWSL